MENSNKKSRFYRFICATFSGIVKVLFNIRVVNPENEPEEGGCLICANHVSASDPVIICYAFKKNQAHFMAKKELFKIPLLKNLLSALGAYPVDRKGADVSTIKKTIQMIKDGKCVGIFPQGHREKGIHPKDANLKQGAAMIAIKAEATILPCCIKTKKMKFSFFRRVDVYFGKPIPFEELAYDPEASGEYMRITKFAFDRVCQLYDAAVAEDEAKKEGKKRGK